MSNSSVHIFGIVLTCMNVLILVLLTSNIIKSYKSASNIDKAISKTDVDFYFLMMFQSMVYFVANAIALYTGIMAFLMHPLTVLDGIVYWRIADRTGMLIVAIVMIWQRMRYNPFNK